MRLSFISIALYESHRVRDSSTPRSRRMEATAAFSTVVGAVSTARAVGNEKPSRKILKSAADELRAPTWVTALRR